MSVKDKLDILDLIIDVLLTHEMMLDAMIGRLEGLSYNFETASSSDEALSTREFIEKLSENPIEMIQEGSPPIPLSGLLSARKRQGI